MDALQPNLCSKQKRIFLIPDAYGLGYTFVLRQADQALDDCGLSVRSFIFP